MKNPLKNLKDIPLTLALAVAVLACSTLFIAGPTPSQAQPAALPHVGFWIDHTGRGAVEINKCGNSLCGYIAWLKDPNQANGKPMVDYKGRPLCGLQIIGELKLKTDGSWDDGWIYDPERDEKFSVELRMKSQDSLQVLGYLGMKMLGETFQWKRGPANHPRCKAA